MKLSQNSYSFTPGTLLRNGFLNETWAGLRGERAGKLAGGPSCKGR
jgi:hypothetical protein